MRNLAVLVQEGDGSVATSFGPPDVQVPMLHGASR